MARPLRIEYPGAWYHVMNRGAGRRKVFNTDEQRAYFLSLLGDTYERFNAEWHVYCLMANHYHLLIRTPEGNLQRIMRHVNGLYTQFFNRSEGKDGPLFRGRYKAILVDADAYWLELSRYIHRNPLEANIVRDLVDYRWSSYRAYVGLEAAPQWLSTDYVLNAIGVRRRQVHYAAFVAKDVTKDTKAFYGGAKIPPIMGDDAFREQVLKGRLTDIDRPELRRARVYPTVEQIVLAVKNVFGVEESVIRKARKGRGVKSPERAVAMYLCQEVGNMRLAEIAKAFGLASYASAGSAVRKVRYELERNAELRAVVESLKLDLTP